MNFKRTSLSALIALSLLSGCASLTRTDYQTPAAEVPAQWQHAGEAVPQAVPARWWLAFGDPRLNALIEEALARNPDLAAAAIKLKRARLQAGLSADAMNPVLSASASDTRGQQLRYGQESTRSATGRLALSWEADLWGKLAHARDAADWEALATAQDREATALSLTGSVASLYWKLAWLNQRIDLSRQNISHVETTLALALRKFEAGSVSKLDVLQAEQDLASLRASHTQLLQQREESRSAFALLFDGVSKDFAEPAHLPEAALPAVDAGLPASLLARRPDLAAAELRLRSTLATADATRASYYPGLSLTGSLGTSSTSLLQLLNNPIAGVMAELSLPFLQYQEMKLKNGVARADYELAALQFRQSLYAALGEVDTALSARSQYRAQGEHLERSLRAAEAAEKINELRYRSGAIPLQTWLDSQQTRRSAEAALADNRYNQFAAHASLSLALGGSADL
ncbi:efflux transporter outer membrane subunit [Uliginosibacterium sp. 31-12]|uniref:efflux transporter outer membrane subunit n=1 Tax=Uliginosibacterium sp. 31-12 TaxID=3062781 RepID=UPI0026E3A887|nr:efflux transporter outer membrane subunit [Uliginosibacterium sp. 31-12]MDO6386675.1 efflux transporter outer membrane subunit [Uliginosibacterium sp. 31-12]